jgi:4'-phosphopantetheinyl transferase
VPVSLTVPTINSVAHDRWCRVWVADVAWGRPQHDSLLDPVERSRAEAYVQPIDRARFVLGVALLKQAVAQAEGVAPETVMVDRRCAVCGEQHGAPLVRGSNLHVSVAHSGERVVAAITPVGAVGVDVEARAMRAVMPKTRDVLAPSEVMSQSDDFFTYWCRKESVLKATGAGMTVSMLDVVVSPASEPARLVSYEGNALPAFVADLDLDTNYAGALTILSTDETSVEVASARSLL